MKVRQAASGKEINSGRRASLERQGETCESTHAKKEPLSARRVGDEKKKGEFWGGGKAHGLKKTVS